MANVCLIATMDTKAAEARFLRARLERLGLTVTLVDTGILRPSPPTPRSPSGSAGRAGGRGGQGQDPFRGGRLHDARLCRVVGELRAGGRLDAVVSLGGSGGTSMASAAMRTLPLGVPKVIVSTMASGNTLPYVQGEDILLLNPVVDIQNLNFLTTNALSRAAAIVAAMLAEPLAPQKERRAIAVSGFGGDHALRGRCVARLEKAGYEVLVFHARGMSGGRIMEKMIAEGHFAGVLDLTTSEIADEVAAASTP